MNIFLVSEHIYLFYICVGVNKCVLIQGIINIQKIYDLIMTTSHIYHIYSHLNIYRRDKCVLIQGIINIQKRYDLIMITSHIY